MSALFVRDTGAHVDAEQRDTAAAQTVERSARHSAIPSCACSQAGS